MGWRNGLLLSLEVPDVIHYDKMDGTQVVWLSLYPHTLLNDNKKKT